MFLHVYTVNNPDEEKLLRTPTADIEVVKLSEPAVQELMDNMVQTMYEDDGIGIAAPQVGYSLRICVIGKEAMEKQKFLPEEDLILVNPTWERAGRKTDVDREGCLSVPYTYGKVKRYRHIQVSALDRNGKKLEFEAKDFLARVIQHEVDHLNGTLFIDRAKGIYTVED